MPSPPLPPPAAAATDRRNPSRKDRVWSLGVAARVCEGSNLFRAGMERGKRGAEELAEGSRRGGRGGREGDGRRDWSSRRDSENVGRDEGRHGGKQRRLEDVEASRRNLPTDPDLKPLRDDPRAMVPLGKAQKAALGVQGLTGRNTESFDPASTMVRPQMRVLIGPNRATYGRPLKHDDVVMVPEFLCKEDDWSLYYQLVGQPGQRRAGGGMASGRAVGAWSDDEVHVWLPTHAALLTPPPTPPPSHPDIRLRRCARARHARTGMRTG